MSDSQATSKAQSVETTNQQSAGTTVEGETQEKLRDEWVQYDFDGETAIKTQDVNVHYGDEHALHDISMEIPKNSVTALIGPSGCGKSTFLRCLNRMNDRIKAASVSGEVEFDGKNIYDDGTNLVELRKRVGQVFQSPNPFPKSIRENISYGPRKHGDIDVSLLSRLLGRDDRAEEEELVERCLRQAALWDEVNDRLDDNALGLSGGQQQRLCIARALATDPEVLLMDEPASALDPIATSRIEDLINDLSDDYTVVIVTHNMQQAARISDQTAVFLTGGYLVEYDDTDKIFENPESQRVEDYITGKFG
ncbi:phosphate ABC transporter ATP-binding protein, PhoT family (TC 3.A.1.7.1) [Halogeometricum rufum]|uniref:Phosphate ABC transporter ATP-binding protein, PhoT family (TC 3.A.1.7.1) n=1 Tax=Halogeometricum rufum TaxID=553469 RepID=A0A1I6HZX0_9EURY|nr:phosphate ABC transporter ATP-binding protein PstB [Halogeometricum rufum]SFR59958.1 phosphate ABC transporter ATP-binding protein, PhoT family (TC 3.A.1.7.1) [Halogeometricum rufum]